MILLEKSNLISYSASGIPFKQWLLLFDNICYLNEVTDNELKKRLLLHFLGPKSFEKVHLIAFPKSVFDLSFENLKKYCYLAFGEDDVQLCHSINDLINLKQKPGECIEVFYLFLKKASIQIGLSGSDLHKKILLRTFLNGVRNLEIRRLLKADKNTDLYSAYQYAKRLETIEERKVRENKIKYQQNMQIPKFALHSIPNF